MFPSRRRFSIAKALPRERVEAGRLLLPRDDKFRGPEQGALDFGVGEGADGLAGGFGIGLGALGSGIEGAVAPEDIEDIAVSDAVEGALAQNGFDAFALGGRAMFERVDDRHGGFALAQIAG